MLFEKEKEKDGREKASMLDNGKDANQFGSGEWRRCEPIWFKG